MSDSDVRSSDQPVVLVADDDEDILELVTFRLERSGYTVMQARDGEEALRRRARAPARPRGARRDDAEARRLRGHAPLRADEATSRMPIILLTARSQDADVKRGFEAGADDYLRKPFSPQELRARVQAILGRR